VAATVEYYDELIKAFHDFDGLTVLVVADASRESVARVLGIDLGSPHQPRDVNLELSAWALLEVPGGVLAIEWSGYGDPSLAQLRSLTRDGGTAAVVRDNIQAHIRFGYARDGEVLFDEDEYVYDADPDEVPSELRPLFDLVYDDLEDDDEDEDDAPSAFVVGLAMAELVTGVELTAAQVEAVTSGDVFEAPALVYPDKS